MVARGFILIISVVFAGPALAHGGGLDGYGCHNNRKQGGYHCHRGQFAGQSFASKDAMLTQLKERPAKKSSSAK
jgi:hypothetical protein